MSDTPMVILTEKCTAHACGRVRHGELTDDLNTHWHVKRGVSLVPLSDLLVGNPSGTAGVLDPSGVAASAAGQPAESAAAPGPVEEAADAGLDALAVEVAAALDAPGEGYQVTRGRLSGGDVRRVLRLAGASLRGQREKEVAELERIGEQASRERDEAEQWADRLAAALGGEAVGEHSSANNPWAKALELAAERDARVRAEERQRAASELQRSFKDAPGVDWGDVIEVSRRILAAGSAVPVATPEYVGMDAPNGEPLMAVNACEHGHTRAHRHRVSLGEYLDCPGPVATPTQPATAVLTRMPTEDETLVILAARDAGFGRPAEQDGQR